jgi:hypothetical protein
MCNPFLVQNHSVNKFVPFRLYCYTIFTTEPTVYTKRLILIGVLLTLAAGQGWEHKVHLYQEYHSVYLLVGIGTPPPPLPQASVPPPPNQRGALSPTGEGVWGGGSQSGRLEKKTIAICLLCGRCLMMEAYLLQRSCICMHAHCTVLG